MASRSAPRLLSATCVGPDMEGSRSPFLVVEAKLQNLA